MRHAGVRRLCVAAATGSVRLLSSACQSGAAGRLYVPAEQGGAAEMAFAPPGVDEAELVTRLIAAVRRLAATMPGVPRPVLMAYHVGITRIENDRFSGPAVLKALALLSDPAIQAAAAGNGDALVVVIPDGLYAELRGEGLPGRGWFPVPAAGVWMQRRAILPGHRDGPFRPPAR